MSVIVQTRTVLVLEERDQTKMTQKRLLGRQDRGTLCSSSLETWPQERRAAPGPGHPCASIRQPGCDVPG